MKRIIFDLTRDWFLGLNHNHNMPNMHIKNHIFLEKVGHVEGKHLGKWYKFEKHIFFPNFLVLTRVIQKKVSHKPLWLKFP